MTPERLRIDEFYKNLGNSVKEIRVHKKLTQEEFGELFGMSRVAVNCIEQRKQRLSVYHYAVICQEFRIDLMNLTIKSIPFEPKKTKLQKKIAQYKAEVLAAGLTEQQKQGAELVFIGLESIIT